MGPSGMPPPALDPASAWWLMDVLCCMAIFSSASCDGTLRCFAEVLRILRSMPPTTCSRSRTRGGSLGEAPALGLLAPSPSVSVLRTPPLKL